MMPQWIRWLRFLPPDLSGRLILCILAFAGMAMIHIAGILGAMVTGNGDAQVTSIVMAAVYAAAAHGMISLRPWARRWALGICVLWVVGGILWGVYLFSSFGQYGIRLLFTYEVLFVLGAVMLHGLIALYLFSPKCKQLFHKTV